MALTQEEIRIRAGLDYSKVTAGLTDIRQQVYKLAGDVPKQLGNILKANVFGAAAGIIAEILPSWDEIWSKVYGVDESAAQKLEESGERLRTLRKQIEESRAAVAKTSRDQQFDEGDSRAKFDILKAEAQTAKSTLDAAREKLKFAKEHRLETEKQAEAQIEVNKSLNSYFVAQKAFQDFTKKMTPEQLASEFGRSLKDNVGAVQRARVDIESANINLAEDPNDVEMQRIRQQSLGVVMRGVRLNQIQQLGDLVKNLPSGGMMGGIKEQLALAQQEAMKSVIQKVAIVEIDPK